MRITGLSKLFKMRCPYCFRVLQKGGQRRYTNTAEHVFDPNGEYERPLRDIWTCSCKINDSVGYYDEDGALYVRDYKKLRLAIPKRPESTAAIFSWEWFFGIGQWFHWKELRFKDWWLRLQGKEGIFYRNKKEL